MINIFEVNETNQMIEQENLDVRTITMGISLLDCASSSLKETMERIYEKITVKAKDLVQVGKTIEGYYGIPIVNKRISVTPIGLVGASLLPVARRFCGNSENTGSGSKGSRREFPGRLFGPCFEGNDESG